MRRAAWEGTAASGARGRNGANTASETRPPPRKHGGRGCALGLFALLALVLGTARAAAESRELCGAVVESLRNRVAPSDLTALERWCDTYDVRQPPHAVLDLLPGERLAPSDVSALMQLAEPRDPNHEIARALAAVLDDDYRPPGKSGAGTQSKPSARACTGFRRSLMAQNPLYAAEAAINVPALLDDGECLGAVYRELQGLCSVESEDNCRPFARLLSDGKIGLLREALRSGAFLTVLGSPSDDVRLAVRAPPGPGAKVAYTRLQPISVGPSSAYIAFVPRSVAVSIRHLRRAPGEHDPEATGYLPSIYQFPAADWSASTAPPRSCLQLRVAASEGDRVLLDGMQVVQAKDLPAQETPQPTGMAVNPWFSALEKAPPIPRSSIRLHAEPGQHRLLIIPSQPASRSSDPGKRRLIKMESELELRDEPRCAEHIVDVRNLDRIIVKVVATETCERKGLIIEQVRRFAVDALRDYSSSGPRVMDFEAWAQSVAGIRELRDEMGARPELKIGGDRGYLDVQNLLGSGTAELWRQGFKQAYIIRLACSGKSANTTVVAHQVKLDQLFRAGRDPVSGADAPDEAVATKHENVPLGRAPQAVGAMLASFCAAPHLRVSAPVVSPLFPAPGVTVSKDGVEGDITVRAELLPSTDTAQCENLNEFQRSDLYVDKDKLTLARKEVKANSETELLLRTPGMYLVQASAEGLRSPPLCMRVEDHKNWLFTWVGWMRTWDTRDDPKAARDNLISVVSGFTVDARHTSRLTIDFGMLIGYGVHSKNLRRPPAWDGLTASEDFTTGGDMALAWIRHGVMFGPLLELSIRKLSFRARARHARQLSFYTRFAIPGDLGFIPVDAVPSSLVAFRDGHRGNGTIADFDVDLLSALGLRWRLSPSIEVAAAVTFGMTAFDDALAYWLNDSGRQASIAYDFAPALGFATEVSLGL